MVDEQHFKKLANELALFYRFKEECRRYGE